MNRLTEAQTRALDMIARGRPVAGNDGGWVVPDCARPTLSFLERVGLVEREGYDAQGIMCGSGLCRLSPAGRAALASPASGEDGDA